MGEPILNPKGRSRMVMWSIPPNAEYENRTYVSTLSKVLHTGQIYLYVLCVYVLFCIRVVCVLCVLASVCACGVLRCRAALSKVLNTGQIYLQVCVLCVNVVCMCCAYMRLCANLVIMCCGVVRVWLSGLCVRVRMCFMCG